MLAAGQAATGLQGRLSAMAPGRLPRSQEPREGVPTASAAGDAIEACRCRGGTWKRKGSVLPGQSGQTPEGGRCQAEQLSPGHVQGSGQRCCSRVQVSWVERLMPEAREHGVPHTCES